MLSEFLCHLMGNLLGHMDDVGRILDVYLNCRTPSCLLRLYGCEFAMFLRDDTLLGLRICMHKAITRRPEDSKSMFPSNYQTSNLKR